MATTEGSSSASLLSLSSASSGVGRNVADQGVNPVATILAAIATSQREMRELRE